MKLSPYKITSILGLLFIFASFSCAQTERELGIKFYQEGRYGEAVVELEKAGKQKNTDAELWNYLGLAYTRQKDNKKAVKAFEKAIKFEAGNAAYRVNLAYVYFLNNQMKKAQSESTRAININPQMAFAYYIRGMVSNWKGDYEKAINDANKAIAANPAYEMAYILKSAALLSTFGERVGSGGSKPIDEIDLLRQSKDALETCLKSCRNSQALTLRQERLNALEVFYDYFDKRRDAVLSSAPGGPIQDAPNYTPLKLFSKPRASYPQNALNNGIEGMVRLAVLFSEDGRVTHTIILKGLNDEFDDNAVDAAKQIKFEPAKQDGKPISVVRIIEYVFGFRD